MSKKDISYHCSRCNREIRTIDKILYGMRCKPCFLIEVGVKTDPWNEVERCGKERYKK